MLDGMIAALLLSGAATAAAARLVTRETGLFGVFVKIRNLFTEHSEAWEIVNCPLCFSCWMAPIFVVIVMLLTLTPAVWFVVLYPAAIGVAYALLGLAAMIQ